MKPAGTRNHQQGFALVITLALLALLVLAVYALSGLTRVGSHISTAGIYQMQARQNALFGLNFAVGQLQRYAGVDNRLTGIAGVTGTGAGSAHPTRQWSGVWNDTGGLLVWLSSGGELATMPNVTGTDSIALVAAGSVGSDATDREFTRALRRPVTVFDSAGQQVVQGNYAYWVGDEGVKLSLVVPGGTAPVSGGQHGLEQYFASLAAMPAALAKVQEYGQVKFVVTSAAEKTNVPLYFHSLGRTHFAPSGTQLKAGYLNVNSSSARYWSGVGATYNRLKSAGATSLDATRFGNAMDNATLWSATSSGKGSNGPFQTVDAFMANTRVINAVTSGVGSTTMLDFTQALRNWLTVRSDTFRIRAYGDAMNPADPAKIESVAYCEAIIQRTPEMINPQLGRRFVITYFRWLRPDDI